jgi:uncharacterized membrane protein
MVKNMGQVWSKRNVIGVLSGLSLLLTASCGVDVGKCDATMLGGNDLTGTVNTGQTVVNSSCASGRCHSETATGMARNGAPAGLNFDVLATDSMQATLDRIDRGAKKVKDKAEQMWAQIDADLMPPKGLGAITPTEKEQIRNWLACGAPVSKAIGAAPTTADWASIYAVFSGTCLGCHSSASAAAGGNFAMGDAGDACGSYAKVVTKAAVSPMCMGAGRVLIVPGQPDNSLLVQKVEGKQQCGASMPLGAPMPLAATNPDLVQKLREWITAGAPKPAGCM